MEYFQIALNSLQAHVARIPTTHHRDLVFKGRRPTHQALVEVLACSNAAALYDLLQDVRSEMENVVACHIPRDPVGILQSIDEHVGWLACDFHCAAAPCGEAHDGLIASKRDLATGVAWGLLSALPVVTFSPSLQKWFLWGDVELTTVRRMADLNAQCFHAVSAADLASACAIGMEPVARDDPRLFFAISFVGAEVRGQPVIHELVSAIGGGFFAVLARDSTVGQGGDAYLFPAVSRTSTQERPGDANPCKVRDVLTQARSAGYLAFVSYIALRSFRSDVPPFSFVTSPESKERAAILQAVSGYVLAASRLWATERILQTLRRELIRDVRQERFSSELSSYTAADRVFTGIAFEGSGVQAAFDLSKRVVESRVHSLRTSVLVLLLALNSIVLDARCEKIELELANRMIWPKLLHQLHMEGNTASAATLLESIMTDCGQAV